MEVSDGGSGYWLNEDEGSRHGINNRHLTSIVPRLHSRYLLIDLLFIHIGNTVSP